MAVSGCERERMEIRNVNELESSLTALGEQVEPGRRGLLDEAITYLVGGEASLDVDAKTAFPDLVLELYRPILGMTAEEIIDSAQRTRLIEVQLAIAEFEEKQLTSEQNVQDLRRFTLEKSRVFKRNRGYLEWPVIEFRAGNNTDQRVWLIHFRAALLRPGAAEPLLIEEFDQLVLDGLAPDQRALWRIEPLQEEWISLIEPHPDLRFTLEVMRLEALGGKVIAATEWGEVETARLAAYRQKLEIIRQGTSLALDDPDRL